MEQCCLCQADIQTGAAMTEFPCHHKCHTECIFRRAFNIGFGITCDTCNTLIVPMDVFNNILRDGRQDDDEVDKKEMSDVKDKLTSNKDFKKDAKLFKGCIREYRSAKTALKRKMTESKTKFRQEVDSFVHMIKDIRKRYMDDAKTYPEYKRYALSKRNFTYYLTRFSRKWNIHRRNFYKSFVKRNDYWFLGRYYSGPTQMLKRSFRVRGFY
jgi:hypothetical protein